MSHACPIKDCKREAHDEHLMCVSHWRRVPKLLQRAVWDTFSRYSRLARERTLANEAEFFEARAQYTKATSDAIAAVEAKEAA